MKKLFAVLLLVALALPVFANDATVLPAGVLRARVIPTFAFGDQSFDKDGEKVDLGATVNAFNLGFAVEYGINDWMTAGLQWAPGWNLWSEVKPDTGGMDGLTLTVNGVYDLFAGVAMQIVGPKAPVASDTFRFVATPAVIIPLAGHDWDEVSSDLTAFMIEMFGGGSPELSMPIADVDNHAFAFGGRLSGDYIINDMFYLNLCGEFKKFLERKDAKMMDPNTGVVTTMDINNGYDIKAEFEPHFVYNLGNNSNISASLPVTYKMWPEVEYNGTAIADTDGYSLTISPNVGYFFFAGPLPMELQANYAFPVMGKNVQMAMNSVTLQIKTFVKF